LRHGGYAALRRVRARAVNMLSNYLPALIFLAVATGLATQKLSAYECGFEAFEDTRMKFDVRYYLVAILFIVFDLEIAFLFPWAVALKSIGTFGLVAMGIFLGILIVGFIYEWKKGALEWD
jgi:NADH-quinone oxidoreductase subunit A